MKKSIFIVLLAVQLSNAQNAKVDSLKSLVTQKTGIEKIDLLYDLAIELADLDNDASLQFAKESLKMASLIGDSLRMVKSGWIVTGVLRRLERPDSAILVGSYYEKIAYRNSYNYQREGILNTIGVAYLHLAKYDVALIHLFKSLKLCEKSENKEKISISLNNIGLVYYKLKDYSKALEYFNKSLLTKNEVGLNSDQELINISLCHAYLGNLIEAREWLQTALKKCDAKCTLETITNAHFASGVILYKSDSLAKAEREFLRSYKAAKYRNDHRFIFDNIIFLSKIYMKEGNLGAAEKFLMEGKLMTGPSHFDLEEIKLYEELCSLYTANKDFKKLSHYQEKYIQLKDSVFNEKHTNNLMALHAEATENENKAQLTSQEQTMILKDQIIKRQKGINVLIGLVVLLMAVLIYFLFRILQDRKFINLRLDQKVKGRTEELKRNHDELILAINQRDALIAKLSHDLTTSLKSMQMLCSSGSKTETNSIAIRYFEEINSTTLHLSNSLNNILAESKIAS